MTNKSAQPEANAPTQQVAPNNDLLAGLPLFATLDDAINAAAEHLPAGYELKITIEKNGYSAVLDDPHCQETALDGGDGIRSDIWQAIMLANGLPC